MVEDDLDLQQRKENLINWIMDLKHGSERFKDLTNHQRRHLEKKLRADLYPLIGRESTGSVCEDIGNFIVCKSEGNPRLQIFTKESWENARDFVSGRFDSENKLNRKII